MSDQLPIPHTESNITRTDEDFDSLAQGKKFLKRIQLGQGGSEFVKSGRCPVGQFAFFINKDNLEVLGPNLDVHVCDWRSKAMKMKGGEPELISYIRSSPEFQMIEALAAKSKFGDEETGLVGPEFLFWIPAAMNARGAFATLFCSNATMRREAPNIKSFMQGTCTLKAKYIKKPKYSWHGVDTISCSKPIPLPTPEALLEAVTMFRNPPISSVEVAEESAVDR